MINNKYGIKEITMYPTATCFCPLGGDWYENQFEIVMQPSQLIPDYCKVDEWLDENIRGKSLIIEEAVNKFYEYLQETYQPKSVHVFSNVDNAKHFPVRVKKYE